jgi:hypothetical protein
MALGEGAPVGAADGLSTLGSNGSSFPAGC